MAIIMSFDAMLSAAEGDEVQVRFEMDEDSAFVDFAVGEDEDEITFAFAPSDAAKWAQAFRRAAQLTALAEVVSTYGGPRQRRPCTCDDGPGNEAAAAVATQAAQRGWEPCLGAHRRKTGHPYYSGPSDLERRVV